MDTSDIAKRMKSYERLSTSNKLMPMLPTVIRLDGRSFSKFTKGLGVPFDSRLTDIMVDVTKQLVVEYGAVIGYTQSDEITIVLPPVESKATIFSGKYFKLTSNIASMCTVLFYKELLVRIPEKAQECPTFDCRVFQVPTEAEAINALIWREIDATKNSVSMVAHSYFPTQELYKKNSKEMKQMLLTQRGVVWEDYAPRYKRGTYVQKYSTTKMMSQEEIDNLPEKHTANITKVYSFKRSAVDVAYDMSLWKDTEIRSQVFMSVIERN